MVNMTTKYEGEEKGIQESKQSIKRREKAFVCAPTTIKYLSAYFPIVLITVIVDFFFLFFF